MEQKFQNVVREYRKQTRHSVRGFGEALTEKFSNTTLSGQTISRWETEDNVAPDLYLFFDMIAAYTDWRMHFGVDALKALVPHVFDAGLVTFHLPKAG